jgi:hypothetical protein
MILGLRPSSFEFIYNASNLLKKDLLYFEQVHVCSFNEFTIFKEIESFDPQYFNLIQKELEPLFNNHLLHKFNLTEILDFVYKESGKKVTPELEPFYFIHSKIPRSQLPKKFPKKPTNNIAPKIIAEYQESVNQSEDAATRVSSVFLNTFSKDETIPLLQKDIIIDSSNKANVLEVILSKMPIPDEKVSWEKIIEYRKDPDTTAKFNALRVWMQDISRQNYSKKEISDRIDHLLHEYEQHLNFHKLKYTHGTFRVFITTLSEIIENLVTLKFSKVTETIFSLSEKKLDLFEVEMQAPGREVAYISKAKNIFT